VGSEGLAEANAGKPVIDPNKNTREEGKRIAQTFILRLTALAKALRYIPGQKHFIFFSTGVPSSLIYGGQSGNPSSGQGGRAMFDPGDRVLRTQNEEMYKEFGLSAVSSVRAAVRAAPREGLRLGTPLLLRDETGCAYLDARGPKGRLSMPWREVYAYDRTLFAPVAGSVSKLTPAWRRGDISFT
jgi:hypothetical protein